MIEILHDVLEAFVLLANQVTLWHVDVVKRDVCGAGRPHSGALHLARREAWHATLDELEAQTPHAWAAGAASNGEVVSEDAVRDPLLLSVQDVVVALELGSAPEVGDVTACSWLRDAKTGC